MTRLDPATIDLLIETLANAFWYKRGLLDFLRRCGCAQHDLESAEEEGSKSKIVRWLVLRYEQSDRGHDLLREIASAICRKATFPDLAPDQQAASIKRQGILLRLLVPENAASSFANNHAGACAPREKDIAASLRVDELSRLRAALVTLCTEIGTPKAGHEFERWLTQLAIASGLEARGRYTANGREFDGSICVESDVYLVEAKFRLDKADAHEISNLRDKVNGHADGALGLFVSMSGYTSNAVENASRARTPLVLLHSQHLFAALGGTVTLGDVVSRSRRQAKETGCPLLTLA